MLTTDRDGFLVGDSDQDGNLQDIPPGVTRETFVKALGILQAIKGDTAAMRWALANEAEVPHATVATPARPRNAPVLTDRQVRALGRLVADRASPGWREVATPGRAARSGADGGAPAARMPLPVREVATPGRGSNGRFLSRAERDGGTADDAQGKDGDSRLAGAAERLGDAVDSLRAAGDAAEAVDPTMMAVREVGEVVTPVLAPMGGLLKTGFGKLFGRGESEEVKQARPWYKRILKELVELRRNSGAGPAASSRPGMLMPLLTSVAGFATPMLMGLLGAAIPLLLAGAGALLAGGIGWKIGEWINEKWGQQISDAVWNTSEWIKEKWGGAADWFQSKWEGITSTFGEVAGKFGAWLDGLAGLGGKVVEKAKEIGGSAVETIQQGATSLWQGAKNLAERFGPEWVKDNIVAQRAIDTGASYRQGNIAGLDEAHTRALVASTVATESSGGRLDARNLDGKGYVGRYQAGAAWLAGAGLIKGGSPAVKAAMKADGHTREWDWAVAGGMDRFLKNDANWSNGMSLSKYMASADIQDAAFKTNSDSAYRALSRRGIITANMSQDDIAGLLKARHIAGEGGAVKAAGGVRGPADANGTTALKYKNDMAAGNVYTETFIKAVDATGKPKKPVASASVPLVLSGAPAKASAPSTPAVPPSPAADGAAPAVVSAMPPAQPAPLVMASAARPVSAAIPMPTLASMAPAPTPAPPPAPAVQTPIGSNARAGNKTTVTLSAPITQNLSDRTIAHVATGGLGG
ncbi:hypothetical protein [Azotobacter chroococcum]|uniref:hypothetical protein n=1 Tax=Azotobacter chroococcum TaxID=353 RepID=UPI0010ADB50E|nr:hypothetical protein [Azotobacter chroococcum]TKD44216.1 hypothetical protein FCG41_07430 [Azotobacter chroococcum]